MFWGMGSRADNWNTEYILGTLRSLAYLELGIEGRTLYVCLSIPRASKKKRGVKTRRQITSYFTWGSFSCSCSQFGFWWSDSRDVSFLWNARWRIHNQMCSYHVWYYCSVFCYSSCPFTLWGLAWKWIPLMGTIISLQLLPVVLLIHWASFNQRMSFLR